MSMSNTSETALLNLLFNNVDWADVGDAAGLQNSATAGSFYVRLHTTDPGDAGTGDTNEISYTGYAPVAVARSALGFTVSGASVSNAAAVQFGDLSGPSGSTSSCGTGATLCREDAEFLRREAARADTHREALDACYKVIDATK